MNTFIKIKFISYSLTWKRNSDCTISENTTSAKSFDHEGINVGRPFLNSKAASAMSWNQNVLIIFDKKKSGITQIEPKIIDSVVCIQFHTGDCPAIKYIMTIFIAGRRTFSNKRMEKRNIPPFSAPHCNTLVLTFVFLKSNQNKV